jgi:chloramphenicol 3-O-phosphotransferase
MPSTRCGPVRAVLPSTRSLALDDDEVAEVLVRARRGYHRAVAGLASAGNDVIMDYPLSEQWRVEDLLNVLQGYDVTLVEIRCAHGELLQREQGLSTGSSAWPSRSQDCTHSGRGRSNATLPSLQ